MILNIVSSLLLVLALWQSPSVQRQLGKASMSETGLLNSGMIVFLDTGSCPTNWTEISSTGNHILLTVAANGDAGATGGSNSYTPAGSNSTPTFTGNAGTVPAETFTGASGTTSAVSAGIPAGTNGTASVATVTASKAGTSAGAFSTIGGAAPGSSFTVPAETFTGSAMGTHTHTLTPTGTNGTAAFTPAGSVSTPTFTGNAATLQPTFVKLIGCKRQ